MPSRSRLLQVPSQSPRSERIERDPRRAKSPYLALAFLLPFAVTLRLRQPNSSMSRLISEPLADHSAKQFLGALFVAPSVRLAMVVAEVELGEVAVQVIVRAVLIDALHAALEDREEAFDGIGVNGRIERGDIFALAVSGEAVLVKVV